MRSLIKSESYGIEEDQTIRIEPDLTKNKATKASPPAQGPQRVGFRKRLLFVSKV